MRIEQADIRMGSSRMYLEQDEVRESLRVWVDQAPQSRAGGADRITISSRAEQLLSENEAEITEGELVQSMDEEISLRKLIAELLSGREVKLARIEKVDRKGPEMPAQESPEASGAGQRQGWGLQYDYEETHLEQEDVSFSARGVIRTADGKETGFSLKLDMSREYIERNSLNVRAGDAAIDPLVINFDGNAAELADLKFDFDLDSDGSAESISMPTAGRGFLAIDRNADGMINDGSELFGPSTGNGFSELAAYDGDGNAWIDENDEVYDRLGVMSVDGQGNSTLQSLREKGVGAIYLGNSSTRFDIRTTDDNDLLGQVRTTGIYLREDGTPGTIQLLDLVA